VRSPAEQERDRELGGPIGSGIGAARSGPPEQNVQRPHRSRSRPRPGGVLTFGMLAVSAVAWFGLVSSRMTAYMRRGLLTGGPILSAMNGSAGPMGMRGMVMESPASRGGSVSLFGVRLSQGATFSWPYFGGFMWMWAVMLAAMMFPVALPGVRRYRQGRLELSRWHLGQFLAGYYTVYLAAGAGAYLVLSALQAWTSGPTVSEVLVGALVLGVVGGYQLSGSKAQYLDHCLATPECSCGGQQDGGRPTPGVNEGLAHGWSCLACCGPLMIVMLLVGIMNLAWMAILTVLMVLERVLPSGRLVARMIGGALVAGTFLVILISPGGVPALL